MEELWQISVAIFDNLCGLGCREISLYVTELRDVFTDCVT